MSLLVWVSLGFRLTQPTGNAPLVEEKNLARPPAKVSSKWGRCAGAAWWVALGLRACGLSSDPPVANIA